MPKRTDMTDRIYAYLQTVIPEQGYAPSVREICQAVGLKSPSTVHFHLKRLQERGLIALTRKDDRIILCLMPIQGKVNLDACPYLIRLGRPAGSQEV